MSRNGYPKTEYDDIINHPHHVSASRPQMSMAERAAQFSPFAALTGYGDVIQETARLTDQKPELSESEIDELDYKLRLVCGFPAEKPVITLTYFVPDSKKSGGSCHTITVRIRKIDTYEKQVVLEDNTWIDIDCILGIDGKVFTRADVLEDGFD